MRLALSEPAAALLAPCRALLDTALARLPEGPELRVEVGGDAAPGLLALDPALADGPVHPEGELALLPLDRWRRAAAEVLVALARASAEAAAPGQPAWAVQGTAVWLADQAAPALQLADPERLRAVATGDLGKHPRAGIAAVEAASADPWRWLCDAPALDARAFLTLGERALDPREGAAARAPVPVRRVAGADIPVSLGPWRWQPLTVPAHRRGGRVVVEGQGAVSQPWAIGDEPLDTLAASAAEGCRLVPVAGGPLGRWELATAGGFGQVFGARGVTFDIRAGGSVHVTLADAFVGPLTALEFAETIGTSGTAVGSWKVAGDHRIRLANLTPVGVTMHGRQRERFAMPAPDGGMAGYLQAMEEGVWRWSTESGRLVLAGTMMGAPLELHFREEGDA